MNCKLSDVLKVAVGAVIGYAVTWKFVENKYKRIAQEEIDSIKEYYRVKAAKEKSDADVSMEEKREYLESESEKCEEIREGVLMGGTIDIPVPQEYADLASKYTSKEVDAMEDRPYVISPEEYGELDGYESISLNYYADGVVADDFDNIVENVNYVIGEDSLDHFGEYEEDCVFVRNDSLRCDYEILRDTRNFEDIMNGDEEE